jgi:hypothetical protein
MQGFAGVEISMSEWLEFREGKPKPKTRFFEVISKCSDCVLGIIHWYPQWRHYTFQPTIEYKTEYSNGVIMDDEKVCQETHQD